MHDKAVTTCTSITHCFLSMLTLFTHSANQRLNRSFKNSSSAILIMICHTWPMPSPLNPVIRPLCPCKSIVFKWSLGATRMLEKMWLTHMGCFMHQNWPPARTWLLQRDSTSKTRSKQKPLHKAVDNVWVEFSYTSLLCHLQLWNECT